MEHLEHRWGARARLEVPVQIDCSSGVIVLGVMRDASVSGGFVTTAVPLPTMSVVKLVPMTTRCRPRGGVEAFVVRRTAEGAGLEWCDLAPMSIVELLAPQEAELVAVARGGELRIPTAPEIRPPRVREPEREDAAV
jgi:hypothetical protein